MTIAANTELEVGQLWSVGHRGLFLIADLRTTGSPVAIMREVARHPLFEQTAKATVDGYKNSEPAASNVQRAVLWAAPAVWEQDRLFFEARSDVRQWTGSVDEWRAAVRS